jgi:malate dehydrogenase (oxaloacetate-decarboxylating)(NADP+)
MEADMDSRQLREAALYYHRQPKPGKIAVTPIKQLTNQYDLALAYSPGVALPARKSSPIRREASTLTSRANLVGVITNGTAVSASGHRPAGRQAGHGRQGRAVQEVRQHRRLRLEIDERDPDKLIDTIARWSRPSAASISKTSRRRSASTSRRSCASA